jgi:hypothetical protein
LWAKINTTITTHTRTTKSAKGVKTLDSKNVSKRSVEKIRTSRIINAIVVLTALTLFCLAFKTVQYIRAANLKSLSHDLFEGVLRFGSFMWKRRASGKAP